MSTDEPNLHRTLRRQLRRLGVSRDTAPDDATWQRLLETVNATYVEADDERYTLERSVDISAREMRGLHEVLSRQALHDPLTGLPNRAALITHLTTVLRACAPGNGIAVLFIDLDGFKQVNDSLGHSAGDELLVRAGERIRGCLRQGDVLARLGGDEFVAVCASGDSARWTTQLAERIVGQLAPPFRITGKNAVVSASVGLAATTDPGDRAEDLLRRADMAMYAAKMAGKARVEVFDESMQCSADERLSVRGALVGAGWRGELRVLFQPIVSLSDEHTVGVEALVRWQRPGVGLLAPDRFIPVAEESALISEVDCWVVAEACSQAADWCRSGAVLAVNVSARTLQQNDFVQALVRALHDTGIPAGQLHLEITETALLQHATGVATNLMHLRDLGVRLSIDDFGTGHSSLSQLRRTSVDVLKIDRSFVAGMEDDVSCGAIIGAIIAMGHALGMTMVAEGVEHASQAAVLRDLGCDLAQGWHFGRPMGAEAIDALLGGDPLALAAGA